MPIYGSGGGSVCGWEDTVETELADGLLYKIKVIFSVSVCLLKVPYRVRLCVCVVWCGAK